MSTPFADAYEALYTQAMTIRSETHFVHRMGKIFDDAIKTIRVLENERNEITHRISEITHHIERIQALLNSKGESTKPAEDV